MKSRIAFTPYFKAFATVTGIGDANVEVSEQTVRIKMGWAFSLATPLDNVAGAQLVADPKWWWGYGVHLIGKGRWIANGTLDDLVEITFAHPVKASTIGIRSQVDSVIVSSENPSELVERLQNQAS